MDEVTMEGLCNLCGEEMLEMMNGSMLEIQRVEASKDCPGCALFWEIFQNHDLYDVMVAIALKESKRTLVILNRFSCSILFFSGVSGQQNPWNLSYPTASALTAPNYISLASARIGRWIAVCNDEHQNSCGQLAQDSVLPTRVLDLGSVESSTIHLRAPQNVLARYICLSYCWGKEAVSDDNLD